MTTKIEVLLSYSNLKKLDTWVMLGRNEIKSYIGKDVAKSTRFYSKDMLYLLNDSRSTLNGSLVFCERELSDPMLSVNWDNVELLDGRTGHISFGNNIVSPNFRIVLATPDVKNILDTLGLTYSGNNYAEVVQSQYTQQMTFTPFVELTLSGGAGSVTINDYDYEEVMSCLGAPFIRDEELEYSKQEILDLAIRPALREFFKWCPKARPQEVSVTTRVQTVPMPSDAYCVVGLSLQQNGVSPAGDVTNPFMYAYQQQMYGGITNPLNSHMGTGVYNVNRNGMSTILSNRAVAQAYVNYTRRVHYEGPYKNSDGSRYITIYSNTNGRFNIWWGIESHDFNDVEMAQKDNAIRLAKAKVMQLFGNLRRQSKSDIPGQVNYDYLITEGKELEKEVITELKDLVKSSGVLRGSL